MVAHVLVGQGQLIDTDFSKTIVGFAEKVDAVEKKDGVSAENSVLDRTSNPVSIKKEIQQAFLDIVKAFRVNGLSQDKDLLPDALTAENERIFRQKTCELLKIELNDAEFDRIWCLMCRVTADHAKRYKEILSYPYGIIHSGTNSIQARHIASELKKYGVVVPKERLFLSFEHGCEYEYDEAAPEKKENLIRKIYQKLNLSADDKVILIQSATHAVPEVFQTVSVERYGNQAKVALHLRPDTIIIHWNNKALNAAGQPNFLIEALDEQGVLKTLPMRVAFFVSSIGDTDLAIETIKKLQKPNTHTYLLPLTTTAKTRIETFTASNLEKVILSEELFQQKVLDAKTLALGTDFVAKTQINHAYIGVPSPIDERGALQIAEILNIPCTIVYEYMFTPPKEHSFWEYVDRLSKKSGLHFAVPLPQAAADILEKAPQAKIESVGHLCIDRSLASEPITAEEKQKVKEALAVKSEEKLVFISGTTQPKVVDTSFLDALLLALSSHSYPHLKLRFGIHPGVKELDAYFQELDAVCSAHPECQTQFQILLNASLKERINKDTLKKSVFILDCSEGSNAIARAADNVAQAVPGALTNEAALNGVPTYFHVPTKTYLPSDLFAKSIGEFFLGQIRARQKLDTLEIVGDVASNMVWMSNKTRYR